MNILASYMKQTNMPQSLKCFQWLQTKWAWTSFASTWIPMRDLPNKYVQNRWTFMLEEWVKNWLRAVLKVYFILARVSGSSDSTQACMHVLTSHAHLSRGEFRLTHTRARFQNSSSCEGFQKPPPCEGYQNPSQLFGVDAARREVILRP